MRARDARVGRLVARDRGAFEPDQEPMEMPQPPKTAAMIDRLEVKSLLSLAGFCGMTLKQFADRYA